VSNVFFNGVACGAGNTVRNDPAAIYASPSYPAFDYSERTGASSIDFMPDGMPTPSIDITGAPRRQGSRVDAGAFER